MEPVFKFKKKGNLLQSSMYAVLMLVIVGAIATVANVMGASIAAKSYSLANADIVAINTVDSNAGTYLRGAVQASLQAQQTTAQFQPTIIFGIVFAIVIALLLGAVSGFGFNNGGPGRETSL